VRILNRIDEPENYFGQHYSKWWKTRDGRVWIGCPGCGDAQPITGQRLGVETWTIGPDGSVTPSVDHSQMIFRTDGTIFQYCKFHDTIKLEGWTP